MLDLLEVQQEVVTPQAGALADGDELGRLEVEADDSVLSKFSAADVYGYFG